VIILLTVLLGFGLLFLQMGCEKLRRMLEQEREFFTQNLSRTEHIYREPPVDKPWAYTRPGVMRHKHLLL